MKQYFIISALLIFTTVAWAQKDIVVDPNAAVRTISGEFNSIKISGGIDLYLSQSDNIAAAVSAANENMREGIKTVIEKETLRIYYDGDKSLKFKNRKLRAYVSFKDLKKIEGSGACDIEIAGSLKTETLVLNFSGACDFKGNVNVETLKINLSGASDINLSGTANIVDIESSGASDVKAFTLVANICTVNVSGASDVNITVNEELNARATGASDVYYKGNGVIKEKKSSGASTIAKRD